LDVNFYYKFTGKRPYYQLTTVGGQTDFFLVETSSYNWADFTVNKKLFKYFTLTAGVKNIFDVTTINNAGISGGAHTNSGATPIGYGRSYFAGLAFNWIKK
jgi:outer membrane receptor for ferrienterochelin and colicins